MPLGRSRVQCPGHCIHPESHRRSMWLKEHVVEAGCGAEFSFSGHQKMQISKQWGFTGFANEFEDIVLERQLFPDPDDCESNPSLGCGLLGKQQVCPALLRISIVLSSLINPQIQSEEKMNRNNNKLQRYCYGLDIICPLKFHLLETWS